MKICFRVTVYSGTFSKEAAGFRQAKDRRKTRRKGKTECVKSEKDACWFAYEIPTGK